MRLSGSCALVTGAASGIGLATASRLAREGARVAMVDRNANQLSEAVASVEGALMIVASVTDEDALASAFTKVERDFGGLDIAVACAGVQLFGADAAAADLTLAAWQTTIDVNLTGAFLTAKHAIRTFASNGGSLILVGSPTGIRGSAPGFDAYSASKAGVVGLVRVLCADYGPSGIRVNAVIPGFTDTPLVQRVMADAEARDRLLATIPLRRAASADEIAAAVAFLASEDASYISGALLAVDGGFTAV